MKQDYLLTYPTNNFETHRDSSDFESSALPLPHVKNKPGYHRLLKSSFGSKIKNIYYNKADCVFSKTDNNLDCPITECEANSSSLCQMKNKCYGQSNRGNPTDKRPSRLCVLRQKVLPHFTSIFKQSASSKPVVKHRERKLAYTSSQKCQACLRKRIRKPYSRRENAIVQPVYALEAGVHLPKVFIPNDGPKNTYSFTSTSDSGNPEKLRRKHSKFKKKFRTEMMREHWNYQLSRKKKYQKHPNTPTDHKTAQQVYNSSTRSLESHLVSSISDYSYMTQMPSAGFWDFLFDKIHTKYQIHKCEVKPCGCTKCSMPAMLNASPSLQCCCDPRSPCFHRSTKSNQFPSKLYIPLQCSPPQSPASQAYHAKKNSSSTIPKPKVTCKCKPPSTKKPKSQGTSPKSSVRSPKGYPQSNSPQGSLKCSPKCSPECTPKSPPKFTLIGTPISSPKPIPECAPNLLPKCSPECTPKFFPMCSTECTPKFSTKCSPAYEAKSVGGDSNPCQKDHDLIKNMLSEKYNGEILCIHNPPCILINGCLNLPSTPVEQPSNSFWPILFKNIPIKKHSRKVKREKSCQYGACEVLKARLPEVNTEEKMQSLYSHIPPCDLIRSCDQKKYNSILDNFCNHVPMSTKLVDSAVNRSPWGSLKSYVCDHFPKSQELPSHSRSYDLLTGTESFGAQAQQDTSRACRHNPPCIMVPKCMGGMSVLNNFKQYEAIPDCSHSPVCETVPACCRNYHKEMVSVSSQYPHSCRIV